jgi:hypothetical protein
LLCRRLSAGSIGQNRSRRIWRKYLVVMEVAARLQDAGLIRYSRGHVEVVNRPGFEQRVCECYRVVKREFDRLLPDLLAI